MRWREIGRFIFCERLKQAGTPFKHISPAVPIFRKSAACRRRGPAFPGKKWPRTFFLQKKLAVA
ncbi:hypothetical protein HMPREF3038_02535 [Akkermansia sp. KLE1797]|nr:hypothetical protein HMPREF3038_02535 [Akkermansia sp. KLE1797]